MRIKKLLVANRGEIVLRVLSTCKEMGIETVTIYSEVDRGLPHVYQGSESYSLGSGTLAETYLNQNLILEVAKKAKVDAIHPGYGFLSENGEFCRKVREAGLIFIGPSPEAMKLMGDKKAAKEKVEKLGVPCLPGYHGEGQDPEFLRKEAKKVGYPLLIKAVAGGGGKGMRLVEKDGDFLEALEAAQREALNAFGGQHVLLEKFVVRPRHIEVQVMSDSHGNHLHLFERECSIQRRNQKILEECPSPAAFMDDKKRAELTSEAVKITRSIGYLGAGTIEFLFDEHGKFYFLEMNTRLQVEHPVTEMVTGLDLVRMQIEVAQGNPLAVKQADIIMSGHAIEARIYAEDPDRDFMPSIGKIAYVGRPSLRQTRLEIGYQEGDEVTVNFDPMLAKLVTWGENREEACSKLNIELDHVLFQGLTNNRSYLKRILNHRVYRQGETYTNFLHIYKEDLRPTGEEERDVAGFIGCFLLMGEKSLGWRETNVKEVADPWKDLRDFRNI